MEVRVVDSEETLDLRRRVLRPGWTVEQMREVSDRTPQHAVYVDGRVAGVGLAGGDDDAGAGRQQAAGHHHPDAARAAGDDGGLAGQVEGGRAHLKSVSRRTRRRSPR